MSENDAVDIRWDARGVFTIEPHSDTESVLLAGRFPLDLTEALGVFIYAPDRSLKGRLVNGLRRLLRRDPSGDRVVAYWRRSL